MRIVKVVFALVVTLLGMLVSLMVALAVALIGVVVYLYLRLRRRPAGGGPSRPTGPRRPPPGSAGEGDVIDISATEVRAHHSLER